MRTCKTYETWLSALLDRELDPKHQAELTEHLAKCPACRQYFDDLTKIRDALAVPDGGKAPEGFAQSVMDAVAKTPQGAAVSEVRSRRRPAASHWRRWAAMAACLALVAVAGLWATGHLGGYGASVADKAVNYAAAPRSGESAPQAEPEASDDSNYGGAAIKEAPASDEANTLQAADGCAPMEADTGGDQPAKEAGAARSAGTLTTGCDAARAWVEEQGWTWEPGAEYTLTAGQYEQLLTLLEEETYELTTGEEGGDATFRLIIQ